MSDEVITRALPTRRFAVPASVAVALLGAGLVWLTYRWIAADAAAQPSGQPTRGDMMLVMVVAAVLVGGVLLARGCYESLLTYTPDELKPHTGQRKAVRWARIAAIHAGSFGRDVTLSLKGNGRVEAVPGTRWLTAEQRRVLVADLDLQRRRAEVRARRG